MKDFQFVDVHKSDHNGVHSTWARKTVEDIPKIVDKYKDSNVNLYTTLQRYKDPEHKDDEIEYCSLAFDFDKDGDVELARQDAITIVDHFVKAYGVDISPEEMMIYFSGNRGFHVIVNAEVFGADPQVDMNKVWRVLVSHIHKELALKTTDLTVYSRRRAWRVPNTKHTKSGLYKRALTYDQLLGSVESIRELAKELCDWIELTEVI